MAHYTETSHVAGAGIFATLRDTVENIRRAYVRQRAFVVTYNELNALSDLELNDIGVGRSDIIDIARASAAKL